jgi:hypothetical protein
MLQHERYLAARRRPFARGFMQGRLRQYAVHALANFGLMSLERRYQLGLVDNYAYGLMAGAREAKQLGHAGVTVIEFGVGAGNGLVAMERHASTIGRLTGISISVFGFDTASGLPEPVDHRDLPYVWQSGFYPMDVGKLRGRLSFAKLVIGDVRETVPRFLAENKGKLLERPIAFISFDLDYWSSTIASFDVFRGDPRICLPRVFCYFDDIPWTVEDVGELRAIRDFNEESHGRRIRHPHLLRWNLPFQPLWADRHYEAHLFDHHHYGKLLADVEAERVELA